MGTDKNLQTPAFPEPDATAMSTKPVNLHTMQVDLRCTNESSYAGAMGGEDWPRGVQEEIPFEENAPGDDSQRWARLLLVAVNKGSAHELMDLLAAIIHAGASPMRHERERMELLQGIALKMRLDLHAMLMHIYQRLEASRAYLDVVRHLAGDASQDVHPNPSEEGGEESAEADRRSRTNYPVLPWPERERASSECHGSHAGPA